MKKMIYEKFIKKHLQKLIQEYLAASVHYTQEQRVAIVDFCQYIDKNIISYLSK